MNGSLRIGIIGGALLDTGVIERRKDCPDNIVNAFLDYRGTTAAAIEGMRAAGFDASVANGLSAAFKKSVSMGDAS